MCKKPLYRRALQDATVAPAHIVTSFALAAKGVGEFQGVTVIPVLSTGAIAQRLMKP